MNPTPGPSGRAPVARALATLVLALPLCAGTQTSGATFTASSSSPDTRFATGADFNTVAVTFALRPAARSK